MSENTKVHHADGSIIYEFDGSADIEAVNEFNESDFIGDNASFFYGDEIEFVHAESPVLTNVQELNKTVFAKYFTDTGTPETEQYQAAAAKLAQTPLQYNKIINSSKNVALVQALIEAGIIANRRVYIDIDGTLSPEAAVAWKNQFNYDAQSGMYLSWLYAPIVRTDPTGVSGVMTFGTSGMRAGYAAAHNMNLNALGLPPLQQPIAGKDFMLSGTRITETRTLTDSELALLAENKIIPVMYQEYHDGSGFVWADSLSGAKKSGISKLESAADISIWAQETWGRFSKSLEQKPMTEAIKQAKIFTERTLKQMETSGWLVPSATLGAAYAYEISPNERYPDDRLEIVLYLSINGVVRRVTVSSRLYNTL